MYLRFRNGVTTSQTLSSLWPKRWLRYLKNKSGVIGWILPSLRSKLYECQNRWHTQNDTMCHLINIHLRPAWTFPCQEHIRWNLVIFLILWVPEACLQLIPTGDFLCCACSRVIFSQSFCHLLEPNACCCVLLPGGDRERSLRSLAIQTGLEVDESTRA